MSLHTAPYVSPVMAVEPSWIDYNGHLNMAYYNVLFDRGVDAFLEAAGLGAEAVLARDSTYMTAEIHVCYLREIFLTTPVQVALRVLDVDVKRLHLYAEILHAEEGWVSATSEQMYLHVSMITRRTAPWPDDIYAALEALKDAAATLPMPERAGRRITITRKA